MGAAAVPTAAAANRECACSRRDLVRISLDQTSGSLLAGQPFCPALHT